METILIVDDEKNYRLVLEALLAPEGYEILTAENGSQGLALVLESDLDLVITDMKMPGMSGFTLKRKLLDQLPDIKFIFVTGHGTLDQNGVPDQFDDIFLAKPLNIDTLIDTILQRLHPDQ